MDKRILSVILSVFIPILDVMEDKADRSDYGEFSSHDHQSDGGAK